MKHHRILPLLTLCLSSAFGQISIGPSRELTNYSYLPRETTPVDLDLDGDLDIITREKYFGWVSWYLNDGSGNFSKGGEWFPSIDANQNSWSTLGYFDYDGDGYLDILGLLESANEDTQSICLVRGLAGAAFEKNYTEILVREYDPAEWSDELVPLDFPLQDFDGDGRKDLLFENHIVFLKDAPLTVTETNVEMDDGDIDHPFVDWNGDGLPDLIKVSYSIGIGIRLNQGEGRFLGEQRIELPSLNQGGVRDADIDLIRRTSGTGPLEFCLSYEVDDEDYFSILTKASDGSVVVSATSKRSDFLPLENIGGWSYGVRGERIVIVAAERSAYSPDVDSYELIWNGIELSVAPLITELPAYTFGAEEIVSGDIDGDGTSDSIVTINRHSFVAGGATGEVFWLRNSVGGPYDSVRNSIVDPSYDQSLIMPLDVNLDGLLDLITLQKRLNDGSGRPGSLVLWENYDNGETFQRSILPGEDTILSVLKTFKLDGSLSQLGGEFANIDWLSGGTGLIVSRLIYDDVRNGPYTIKVSYLAQNSSGDFVLLDDFEAGYPYGNIIYLEDLNDDGIDDLVYSGYPGGNIPVAIYANFGSTESKGFEAAVLIYEEAYLEAPPSDFDGDGDLDLSVLVSDFDGDLNRFWVENEGGEFVIRHELDGDPSIYVLEIPVTRLDLDGDGDLDQVAGMFTDRIYGWNRVGWFENKEGADQADVESNQLTAFTKTGWASRDSHLLADLDNDGIKDLVVGSTDFARLEWFKITHGSQPPNYVNWAAGKEISGHSASPLADWDGDSLTNWEEFVFGSDPNRSDQNHLGRPRVKVNSDGPALTFNRRRSAGNEEVGFRYFQSSDLQFWSSWLPGEPTLTPVDDEYEKVSIPLDQPRGFLRVEPILPAEEE